MSVVADVLLLLCSYSVRTQFIAKAVTYGRAGVTMFPEDQRLREFYAHALYLDGQIALASEVIGGVAVNTVNAAYLKARLVLHEDRSDQERAAVIRQYLGWGRKS